MRKKQELITAAYCTFNINKPKTWAQGFSILRISWPTLQHSSSYMDFHIDKLGLCITRLIECWLFLTISDQRLSHRHTFPFMHEQFRGILSELLGKFSGIKQHSISVLLSLQLVFKLQADTTRILYIIFHMTCNIEVLFVLHPISQSLDLFVRVCEEWSFALVSNLGCGCGCGWSGSGGSKKEKKKPPTTLCRKLN